MVDTRVQFWDKESGKGSMISLIFLFALFKVLVLSVNSHWDGTKKLCEECIWIISDLYTCSMFE